MIQSIPIKRQSLSPSSNIHEQIRNNLSSDLYTPKIIKGKLTGLAVGSPYEAVKEQAGGIYAMKMVERGYVILAFDQSFNGESGGNVRLVSSPDINTEDFCASVD